VAVAIPIRPTDPPTLTTVFRLPQTAFTEARDHHLDQKSSLPTGPRNALYFPQRMEVNMPKIVVSDAQFVVSDAQFVVAE
jgi:hypothetical protein